MSAEVVNNEFTPSEECAGCGAPNPDYPNNDGPGGFKAFRGGGGEVVLADGSVRGATHKWFCPYCAVSYHTEGQTPLDWAVRSVAQMFNVLERRLGVEAVQREPQRRERRERVEEGTGDE